MNEISSTIFYNQRIIISVPRETPLVWHCSKQEAVSIKGVVTLTFSQEEWNDETDRFEYEDGEITNVYYPDRYVKAMWAGYAGSKIEPKDTLVEDDSFARYQAEITWSGLYPQLKVGGSYKTFTVNFFNQDNDPVDFMLGEWSYEIDGVEIEDGDITMLGPNSSTVLSENQIKIKVVDKPYLLNKIMKLKYITDACEKEILVELISL